MPGPANSGPIPVDGWEIPAEIPRLAQADPATRIWWEALAHEDVDEAFRAGLLTLREALVRDPAAGRRMADRRLAGLERASRGLPDSGLARARLARKAALVRALVHSLAGSPAQAGAAGGGWTSPTLRTERRQMQSPIARLWEAGVLDDAETAAAGCLRRVVEGLTRPLLTRARAPDALPGGGPAAAGRILDLLPQEVAWEHARIYLPWTREVRGWTRRPPYRPLDLVLDVVVWDRGLDGARRRHHCSLPTARRDVKAALALYARHAGLARMDRDRSSEAPHQRAQCL